MLIKHHLTLVAYLLPLLFLAAPNPASNAALESRAIQEPVARKYDEFQFVAWNDLKSRLETFAVELHQQTENKGYIIVYASGRCSRPAEATNLGNNTKSYLTDTRGIPNNRITVVNGGFREARFFELWLVPPGAAAPIATPTIPRRRARVSNSCPRLPPNPM